MRGASGAHAREILQEAGLRERFDDPVEQRVIVAEGVAASLATRPY